MKNYKSFSIMNVCQILINFFKFLFEDDDEYLFNVESSNFMYKNDKSICPLDPLSIPIVYRCYKCNECYYYRLEEGKLENGNFYCNKHNSKNN